MDEMDQRSRPKRTRVLRATDIIPPFDKTAAPADVNEGESESPETTPRIVDPVEGLSDEGTVVGDQETRDLPKYDLAENILAEQRRVSSRRRRAPSQFVETPTASAGLRTAEHSVLELPCEDLPELQRIVAEIVARDIERLCRRPNPN